VDIQRMVPWLRRGRLPRLGTKFNVDHPPFLSKKVLFQFPPEAVDFLCLAWINDFLSIKMIRALYDHYRRPLLWVLMDQEPVTGGCHYSQGCDGFKKQCGRCPQLESRWEADHSRTIWQRKCSHLSGLPIIFIAPTTWMADRVRESSLYSGHTVRTIPLVIDSDIFHPMAKERARKILGLPFRKKIIFFGAFSLAEPRKGMTYLVRALENLAVMIRDQDLGFSAHDLLLLIGGQSRAPLLNSLPFGFKHLGYIRDDKILAHAYQASDVFVSPSVEDAGPMMIPEAMMCGTPVVAFPTGGAPDLIQTMKNGYLAAERDSADMAKGLSAVLQSAFAPDMGKNAAAAARRRHSSEPVMRLYTRLFEELKERP
jgi:glycosyltransferase involved in cell wall biosynthesis